MASMLPETGVEDGGGNSASLLDPPAQQALFEPPELTPEQFLRRLFRDYEAKKAVALAYYPPKDKKRAGRDLKGPELDQHTKNAVANVDRMLEGHMPLTVRLLYCARSVIPGAGVAIAHFFADFGGTERGAAKVDLVRIQDEVSASRREMEQDIAVRTKMVDRLSAIEAWIKKQGGSR